MYRFLLTYICVRLALCCEDYVEMQYDGSTIRRGLFLLVVVITGPQRMQCEYFPGRL